MDIASSRQAPILLLRGGDDPDSMKRAGAGTVWTGTTDLFRLVKDEVPSRRLHVTPNLMRTMRQSQVGQSLGQFRCVINLIAEAEGNRRSLEMMQKFLRGYRGKVVNPPQAVVRTTRPDIARLLQGIEGLLVPRVLGLPSAQSKLAERAIARAGFSFPVILRHAGTHDGRNVGLFDDAGSLAAALTPGIDHVLIEFADFAGADELYRKHRVFFIGQERVLRHRLVSDHWNVHAKDRARFMASRPALVAEERALFEGEGDPLPPAVSRVLDAVRARIPLDFFGMDFGIDRDGRVILFEANAAMSFFPLSGDPQFAYLRTCLAPAQCAFRQLLDLPERSGLALSGARSVADIGPSA